MTRDCRSKSTAPVAGLLAGGARNLQFRGRYGNGLVDRLVTDSERQSQTITTEKGLAMVFVKTFKGYEDRVDELDKNVNEWIQANGVKVGNILSQLSHEHESRARSGDLIYTVLYSADAPVP